ncbi:hypothetical protein RHABOEDO_000879 [Candidatus Rhabdochlamydia oedothoracis]|uniref:Uncharacterized protein n=1 Tax=Candidatus Rhabdochlamydia oedothoracis TaxID=2720720 RepID=A0ABX8V0D3_9BACT|nr:MULTISPECIES: hypothetical protein [Rhabdochlamydia]KAG6559794.1 hypothetical protein RHOW815_000193 [Candidatus Rhabdochlamydia sp. W815]QYF48677.1 hypothetical protein RHABOEDO_000879 [Candidatus Rhabdochlamydia oedothoracis]
MNAVISKIFSNWLRKLVALVLAIIIWFIVNQTLISTRTINNVPIRIINLPPEKILEGIQTNGHLIKQLNLTVTGNKTIIDELSSYDLEVVLDATDKPDEFMGTISKKNLSSLNPEIDLSKVIKRVQYPSFIVRMTNLVTEQIPIIITKPIGEAPRGYQFLNIWPYRLLLTVQGPEDTLKRLKEKELRLTLNLNEVKKSQLDALDHVEQEVISFFVPDYWTQIKVPSLSDVPISIDDPNAKLLRIDFIRSSFSPLNYAIPVSLFFPIETLNKLNPDTVQLAESTLLKKIHGQGVLQIPLLVNGLGPRFLNLIEKMIQIEIIVIPHAKQERLSWNVQLVNPRQLENQYVQAFNGELVDPDILLLAPILREEYLRNRFRSYVNRLLLFKTDETKLNLSISLKKNVITIEEMDSSVSLTTPSNL